MPGVPDGAARVSAGPGQRLGAGHPFGTAPVRDPGRARTTAHPAQAGTPQPGPGPGSEGPAWPPYDGSGPAFRYCSRSLNFWSLPVAVRGSSVRNSTRFGHL
ncbi:hypothetical protein GCM10018793_00360 [Streptomyces sulfonofaciens]|uniref:Uncharacterized protein n=1 Tax=Streptomyces sulfonofaciens TaxID=68272 RepID=A0A919FMH3_9ACTN|nr:hypothetical protein GCM10018793_00360 [Streptomyces sulfonofaciens]